MTEKACPNLALYLNILQTLHKDVSDLLVTPVVCWAFVISMLVGSTGLGDN